MRRLRLSVVPGILLFSLLAAEARVLKEKCLSNKTFEPPSDTAMALSVLREQDR